MVGKKLAIIVMVAVLVSLALAPESLACRRHYRVYRSRTVAYYYAPRARVAGVAYYHHCRVYPSRPVAYYYAPQARVAGVAYYHHNHSTRNKILTVLGTAAVGAGVGALAGGGKGAGIGALVGGGAGATYLLIKHRHRY